MSRRTLTAIELPAAAALAVCSWALTAAAGVHGHAPWMPPAAGVAIVALGLGMFVAIVVLLDRDRQPDTPPAPRIRGLRAGVRRPERDQAPDPATVARDAQIADAYQRGEIPGRHAPGGVAR